MEETQTNNPYEFSLEALDTQWVDTVFFGIKPVQYRYSYLDGDEVLSWYVRETDLEKLPFYHFWKESHRGSTCAPDYDNPGKALVYIEDWENFCRLFITTGKHRFSS